MAIKKNTTVEPIEEDKVKGMTGSTTSLSPSQMDSAVMDMVDIPTSRGFKALWQGGNLVTASGRQFQMLHVMGLTLVPVLVLLGLSGALFSIRLRDSVSNKSIWRILEHGVEISEVIHNLQQERDLTCLYLSDTTRKTKEFLVDRYPDTDRSLDVVKYWDPKLSVEASGNAPEFYSKDLLKIHLSRHRYQIENGRGSTTKKELEFYTRLIDILIGRFMTAISESQTGNIWRQLVAIQETVTAKESFGLERAYGTIFFTTGGFGDRMDYLTFLEAQDVANASLDNARLYSAELVNSMYVSITTDNKEFVANIQRMRSYIRNNANTKFNGSWTQGKWWFNNMTNYLDILLLVQRNLTRNIETKLDEEQWSERTMLIILGTIFGIIGLLCPLILQSVYAATSDIQGFYMSLIDKTKDINREKRRTESLLYRLLPRAVSEQLKRNRNVVAETFDSVTIFFSNVVDFTTIASFSTPMQVVELLDTMYAAFDERIRLYRVYKVEMIGDVYLVVSGLNEKSESEHAAEIATMSIDLIDQIQLLEVPHHPGTNIQLRIGCHTGPVVAGVVGTRMPRYCLFGETVNIANKMEATGKAGMIQISEATFHCLEKRGGFVTEYRDDPPVDLKMKTYWLKHRLGMTRIKLNSLDSTTAHIPSSNTTSSPAGFQFDPFSTGTLNREGGSRPSIEKNLGKPKNREVKSTKDYFRNLSSAYWTKDNEDNGSINLGIPKDKQSEPVNPKQKELKMNDNAQTDEYPEDFAFKRVQSQESFMVDSPACRSPEQKSQMELLVTATVHTDMAASKKTDELIPVRTSTPVPQMGKVHDGIVRKFVRIVEPIEHDEETDIEGDPVE